MESVGMAKRGFGGSEMVNWVVGELGFGGLSVTFSGKLSLALLPLNLRAASS